MSDVWLPIAGSGISYTLVGSGNAVVNGSDVSATLGFGSYWDLTLASPVNVRVTAVSYQGDPPGAYPGQISAETSDGQQEIINEGGPSAWAPSPMVFNSATEVHYAPGAEESSAYQFLIEVQTPERCMDLGRATRNIVSGYNRDRVFQSRLYAPERRALVTDFNGALPVCAKIVKATWDTWDNYPAVMASPSIAPNGRACQVMLTAQVDGVCCIRLSVELDNGERFIAHHVIQILPARYMQPDNWINGPTQLVATA